MFELYVLFLERPWTSNILKHQYSNISLPLKLGNKLLHYIILVRTQLNLITLCLNEKFRIAPTLVKILEVQVVENQVASTQILERTGIKPFLTSITDKSDDCSMSAFTRPQDFPLLGVCRSGVASLEEGNDEFLFIVDEKFSVQCSSNGDILTLPSDSSTFYSSIRFVIKNWC